MAEGLCPQPTILIFLVSSFAFLSMSFNSSIEFGSKYKEGKQEYVSI